IVMGGNFYQSKPEVGIYDGSYGCMLKGNGKGDFTAMKESESGYWMKGAVRDIVLVKTNKNKLLVTALNNDAVKVAVVENKK
ncbi:MAG: hypothetical protein ABIR18_05375, partial [Chitinophagaceae bacterium]